MACEIPSISDNVVKHLLKLYSNRNVESMLHHLSSAPKITTIRANTSLISSHDACAKLEDYLKSLQTDSKYIVSVHPLLKDILLVVNTSAQKELKHHEKHVIVDTSCGAAILRGSDVFAPGVLAASGDLQEGDNVSVYADLEKQHRKGDKHFNLSKPKFFVGNGIALYDRKCLFTQNEVMSGVAISMTASKNQLPSFANLPPSLFFPQNFPSVVVSYVLNAKENDVILDMCAAPGGKTTHIATLLQNKGRVIAVDKTSKKVEKIKENCDKMRLTNVSAFCYDSTKLVDETKNAGSLKEPPFSPNSFDKILLDPPCSGLGQRPQLRYVMSERELNSYPVYQKKLIKQAVQLLRPGGCLVYSTCTLLTQENEEQVAWTLKTFPELKLVEQSPCFGNPGLSNFGLDERDCERVQRFDHIYTNATHSLEMLTGEYVTQCHTDSIGFFIAKYVKNVT